VFTLHPRLAADTFKLGQIGVCNLYLMNDCRYCWLILVPAIDGLTDLHDLSDRDYTDVMKTVQSLSRTLKEDFTADKINVGALGNLVPQLHIHIIARTTTDAAWPGPVWGHSEAVAYDEERLQETRDRLKNQLNLI
jgi:diadenosine tetraphosphate (Ap4A) HIT family hydrolase